MKRPRGFRAFTKKQEFHSLYLVTTESGAPVKVGIATNPHARFSAIQTSHFVSLRLHRFWWLAGRQISIRIESDFKEHFRDRCIRGEWFDVTLLEAVAFVEAAVRAIGTWGVEEDQVIRLMDHYARQDLSMPPDAPSPLRAAPPELNGPAQRGRPRNERKPLHPFKGRQDF
jgi:hypothetical protein